MYMSIRRLVLCDRREANNDSWEPKNLLNKFYFDVYDL